jgi:valyl-tRNA synthetase
LPIGDLPATDAWILSRLQQVHAEVDTLYERYEFAKVSDLLYHFAWDEVCDWYVELSKPSFYGPDADVSRRVLGEVLDTLLRLLHPLIPFVTEELWTTLTGGESLVIADWPTSQEKLIDHSAEAESLAVQAAITRVRQARSDNDVKPTQRLPATLSGFTAEQESLVRSVARLERPSAEFVSSAQLTLASGAVIELDLSVEVDVVATRARLLKELAAAEKEFTENEAKLNKPAFADKAPEPVIAKVRDRREAAGLDILRIKTALDALGESE